jgi:lysophospholipase L1-like esterase
LLIFIKKRMTMTKRFHGRVTFALLTLFAFTVSAAEKPLRLHLEPLTGRESPLKAGDRIAFLGDSITQHGEEEGGYVWLIEQALARQQRDKNIRLIKAGVRGNKIADLQKRVDENVLSKKPTVVFVYIGINDVWHWDNGNGTTKEGFYKGLTDVITRIQRAGSMAVLATPSVIGERTQGANKHDTDLDAYAQISRKVARENKVVLCDLRKAFVSFLNERNTANEETGVLTEDGVHLNHQGNVLVANHAAASIAKALGARK